MFKRIWNWADANFSDIFLWSILVSFWVFILIGVHYAYVFTEELGRETYKIMQQHPEMTVRDARELARRNMIDHREREHLLKKYGETR